ncbi:SPOSA6832_03779, partial [Sporobolomyces salmonicolor]
TAAATRPVLCPLRLLPSASPALPTPCPPPVSSSYSKKPSSKPSKKLSAAPTSSTAASKSKRPASAALGDDDYPGKRAKRSASIAGKKSLREEELGVGGEIGEEEMVDGAEEALEGDQDGLDGEDDDDGGDGGVTRCVCGDDSELLSLLLGGVRAGNELTFGLSCPTDEEMSSGLMIQCDTCKCWQHGPCVGLWEEKECPNRYFCELCKPNLHGPGGLLRKVSRKSSAPAANRHRSPSVPSTLSHARSHPNGAHKPRESADAALISAFLVDHSAVHDDSSPPPAPKEPKKRSTMNSRDAAYDDAIAMSILEPDQREGGESADGEILDAQKRKLSPELGEGASGIEEGEIAEDGAEGAAEQTAPAREGEKDDHAAQADEYDSQPRDPSPPSIPAPVPAARAKHPNQYTYRPKNGAAAPARNPRASPTKRANGSKSHFGSNGEGSSAFPGGGGEGGGGKGKGKDKDRADKDKDKEWTSSEPTFNLGWSMPEHLKHLAYLLPTATPEPISVPSLSSHHHSAHAYTDSEQPPHHLEPPTKVRFPAKRVTMPEMKKRARNVLEYLSRVQLEMSERGRRHEALTRAVSGASGREGAGSSASSSSGGGDGGGGGAGGINLGALPPLPGMGGAEEPNEGGSASMRMMDALSKEVIMFQQRFFGTFE